LLRLEALPVLGGVAERMRRYPDVQILIAGHADECRTRDYNLAQRLATVSHGKKRPAIAGSSEETWSQNRCTLTE
jgi:peptidoglycan-associated lipoprotein